MRESLNYHRWINVKMTYITCPKKPFKNNLKKKNLLAYILLWGQNVNFLDFHFIYCLETKVNLTQVI